MDSKSLTYFSTRIRTLPLDSFILQTGAAFRKGEQQETQM